MCADVIPGTVENNLWLHDFNIWDGLVEITGNNDVDDDNSDKVHNYCDHNDDKNEDDNNDDHF